MRVLRGTTQQRHMLLAVAQTALLVGLGGSSGYGSDNLWTGASSSDWNDGGNWSFGGVPIGDLNENAVVGTDAPNIATITTDLLFTPSDIVVTGGGRIDHRAGIAGTGGGSWMFVGQDSTPSVYNLADTSTPGGGISGFAQGTGTLNPTGNLMVGSWAADRQGTININTTGGVNISGGLFIANDNGTIGTMNLESGTVVVLHEPGFATDNTQIGHNGGTATLNISGGSLEASRNFRVGNEGGAGTVTITGGSLIIGGTDDIFIGRDRGTGVVNQSGGVVDFTHNAYIGNGNNAGSDTSGTYTLGDGVLNVRREFVVGREGANATHTGTLTMTGGTINKTGDEKMIVGQNNGKGTVTQSGGTINVNNELFIGNENAGAEGTYTLSGTAALNVANELVVGRESGTGTLNVDGGTITTTGNGNMYIGRKNGTGTLNQTGGTISVNLEFGVGTTQDGQAGSGTYDLSGGSLTAAGNIFIGKEAASSGTMTMTGGTMTASDKLQIGHNQATGTLAHSGGIVNVQNEVYIGNETSAASIGTYTLSGSAELNVGNEVIVGRDNGTGTFNLDGGTVIATKISGGTGTSTVTFNGGVMRAKRDEASFIESLGTANVESGGITIDSNGFNVAINQALSGTGGLEKLGIGSLALNGVHTYAGPTRVSAGTLRLEPNSSIAGSVTVDSGASLAGVGTVGGNVVIGTGATLSPGASPGTLTVTGNVTLSSGGNYNWQVFDAAGTAGSETGWDLLSVGGVLDIAATYESRFNLNLWSLSSTGPDVDGDALSFDATRGYTWTIASAAGGITGFAADAFTVNTAATNGAAGFANDLAGGIFSVAVSGSDLNLVFSPGSGPSPTSIVIDVPSGSVTQAQAGYPTIATATSVSKIGAGTVVFDAANAYTGPTTISAGTLEVANADALAATTMTVDTGATLAVASGTTMKAPAVIVDGGTLSAATLGVNGSTGIASLAINAGTVAGSPAVSVDAGGQMSLVQDARVTVAVGGLAVTETSGGGRLDLGAGQVTVAAGGISAADLRADIIAGRSGGAWNGAAGIMSSTAAAAPSGTRAVGYLIAGDGTTRVSFAAPGDGDLSGQVNVFDLLGIDSAGKFGTGQPAVWSQGDFNYDGVTNIFDLLAIDTAGAYGAGNYFPAAPSSVAVTAVPEPSSWAVAAAAVALAAGWRRHSGRGAGRR